MTEPSETFFASRRIGPLQVWWTAHPARSSGEPTARPLLENWFALAPGTLPLRRDARGKPRLEGGLERHDVSWSHSGQALLLATGADVEVGADVERLRPRPRALELAQRFFHPDEAAWLHAQRDDARELAFVRLWCAKEAVLKAHGAGIVLGLEKPVFAETGGELRLVASHPVLGAPEDWTLREWEPLPGYRAALAWRPA